MEMTLRNEDVDFNDDVDLPDDENVPQENEELQEEPDEELLQSYHEASEKDD